MSRPSPYGDVLELADRALDSETGLEVVCSLPKHAVNLRMNFYAKRAELRDIGNVKYDDLVLTLEGEEEKTVVFRKKSLASAVVEVRSL